MGSLKHTTSHFSDGDMHNPSKAEQPRLDPDGHILPYPSLNQPITRVPAFQQPHQLVAFSYTPERVLEFNNSALKYYVEPPRGADLSYRYDKWIRRPEVRGRLDGLLIACLRPEVEADRQKAGVVSWRGIMTKILTGPYEERNGWDMNVMLVNGTMYFEEHLTEAMLRDRENMSSQSRLQTYYGYAFESYCTSSTPDSRQDPYRASNQLQSNGWGGDIDTNVQWCSVSKTKLGETRMIIGGEVDCVKAQYTGQSDTFVELKTSLAIRGPHDEPKFEKKLLKFYFQSFLLGVPEIVVGFRTPTGRITTLQTFKTLQLPRMVRGKPGAWDPQICLDWGHRFLTFLRTTIQNGEDGSTSRSAKVWRVTFRPRVGANVSLLDEDGVKEVVNGEDRVGFLPRSYWDAIGKEATTRLESPPRSGPSYPTGWNL